MEEADSLAYYFYSASHLANVLFADPVRNERALQKMLPIIGFWMAPPERRDMTHAENAAIDLHFYGTVGKAFHLLRDRVNAQMMSELRRFLDDEKVVASNFFLFYVAGALAAHGYDVEFVAEESRDHVKTPDLVATKGSRRIYLEATTRQPRVPIGSAGRLRQLVQGILEEKRQKFADSRFHPGVIVADVSPVNYALSAAGTAPYLKLKDDLREPCPGGAFIYRIYRDPDFWSIPENRGNLLAYLLHEFAAMGAEAGVSQCLIADTRRVQPTDVGLEFPKRHQLVVDRRHESEAMTELAKTIYVVDREAPLVAPD